MLRFELLGRPLLWLTITFVLGLAAQRFFPEHLPSAWFLACVCFFLLALSFGSFRYRFSLHLLAFFFLLFLVLGLLAGQAARTSQVPKSLEVFFNKPQVLFNAEVISPPEPHQGKTKIPILLHSAIEDGLTAAVDAGILLTVEEAGFRPGVWLPGDRFIARLTVKPFHNFSNPGGYDYVRSQAERGFFGKAYIEDSRFLVRVEGNTETRSFSLTKTVGRTLESFRQRAFFWIKSNLEQDTASFYGSLLLGYPIPRSWADHLNRTGTTHLLSISGLHIGLVAMSTFWLSRRIVRILFPFFLRYTSDQHLALWAALLVATLYAFISGLAFATWRSLLMITALFGAVYCYRHYDALTALAASALIILTVEPSGLWQISFQLSFAAMFGMLLVYPRFRRVQDAILEGILPPDHFARKALMPFLDAFWLSLAANIAVMPLLVYHFHGLSLAGFLANTLLVPVFGFLVLPLGLIALALFPVYTPPAALVLKAGGLILGCCQQSILWFSNLSWAFFWVGTLPEAWLATFYLALLIALGSLPLRKKLMGVACAVCPLALFSVLQYGIDTGNRPQLLEATVLDVGQGASTLIQFPSGETMLVDGGGFFDDSFDIGRSVVAPFLWEKGITRLDYVVLTHDHPDHRNGLRFILSHFDVGELWESGIFDPAKGFDEPAAIAEKRNIPIRLLPSLTVKKSMGECRISVLHPEPQYLQNEWDGRNLNNVSLVLGIDYGETRLILPGDIDASVERLLFAASEAAGKTLLVSPHHGSQRSNSDLLFEKLNPQALLIPCGFDNWFGFPHPKVLETCSRRAIEVYRTDLHGAIQVRSDGKRWEIEPFLAESHDKEVP